jgi:hypothetical protein
LKSCRTWSEQEKIDLFLKGGVDDFGYYYFYWFSVGFFFTIILIIDLSMFYYFTIYQWNLIIISNSISLLICMNLHKGYYDYVIYLNVKNKQNISINHTCYCFVYGNVMWLYTVVYGNVMWLYTVVYGNVMWLYNVVYGNVMWLYCCIWQSWKHNFKEHFKE